MLLDEALDAPVPPPIQRGRRRTVVLLAGGAVMAGVAGAVVLNLDRGLEDQKHTHVPENTPGIAPPAPLDSADSGTVANQIQRDQKFVHTGRAWIQATENGRLSQEYRYARSQPAANGRIEMTDPEVNVYLKDNRVLTMRARQALVRVPNQALESGTMTGDVVIRMYETPGGRAPDPNIDKALLEVRTQEASYDNFQGDIHCPGEVDIQTATAWLPATGLRLQINDVEGRPGQLIIDRINGELRLAESVQQKKTRAAQVKAEREQPVAVAASQPSAAPFAATRPGDGLLAIGTERRGHEAGMNRNDRLLQRQRDRIAERRESRGALPAGGARSASEGPFFYRLTLNQRIRIRQGDGSVGWTATGDQLHIVFSLDNADLDQSISSRVIEPQPTMYGPIEPMPLSTAMTTLALAAAQDSASTESAAHEVAAGLFVPSDTDTIITCEGPLTMSPLQNAAEQPASPEDSRFELIGQPVTLRNAQEATTITCETLRYASLSEVMELVGGARQPLTIDARELYAQCQDRLWIDRLNNAGAFEGAGWMVAGEAAAATGDEGAGPPLPPERHGDVRIAWKDGVDLEFAAAAGATSRPDESADEGSATHESFGRLRMATFDGNVAVDSPDFTLSARIMAVGFPARDENESGEVGAMAASQPSDAASQQRLAGIEFMHAQDQVLAGSLSDGGSIACDDLRVDFTSHEGKTVPLKMVALGGVAATDPDRQTIWSDQLEVTFTPVGRQSIDVSRDDASAVAAPAGEQTAMTTTAPESLAKRRADVDMLTATGAVQILMSDGARVFADRLEADGRGDKVVLLGEDVLVASDRTVISKGKRLELTAQGDQVLWPGSGEFAYYTSAVVAVDDRGRVSRPNIDLAANPRQMLATWQESMQYDALFDSGAGQIVIRGSVDAQSTPTALELNVMKGREVTLTFAKAQESATTLPEVTVVEPTTAPATQPQQAKTSLFAMDQRGRQLREIVAVGDAKMESRTWLTEDHSDEPRVFYMMGEHVRYNDQTLEAVVSGAGKLLVQDERVANPTTQPTSQPQVVVVPVTQRKADLPFGGKGTTMFEWTDSLRMTRQGAESTMYDIAMTGGVVVRHRAMDKSMSTMSGNLLEATVDRSAGEAQQRDSGFDLGGSMDLRRIHAQGNVYVDSPTRDVDCDEFDYDYATGIAKLLAGDDRMVTVVTANNPHPVQAKMFLWNTIDDTMQAQKVRGSSGR